MDFDIVKNSRFLCYQIIQQREKLGIASGRSGAHQLYQAPTSLWKRTKKSRWMSWGLWEAKCTFCNRTSPESYYLLLLWSSSFGIQGISRIWLRISSLHKSMRKQVCYLLSYFGFEWSPNLTVTQTVAYVSKTLFADLHLTLVEALVSIFALIANTNYLSTPCPGEQPWLPFQGSSLPFKICRPRLVC